VARSVDVSMLRGGAMPVRVPPQGETAIVELLVKESVGGALQLTTSEAQVGALPFIVPVGESPLQAVYYTVNPDGTSAHEGTAAAADLRDLIGRSWALNSLKASFTAGSWLMNSDDAHDREVARSMFSWVVACVRVLGAGGATIPSDYAELYSQAAALLVTLNVAPGAYYVPVLSSKFYRDEVDNLLTALGTYEGNFNTLDVKTGIQEAVQRVAGTLQGVAQEEVVPLQTQLDNIKQNVAHLSKDILGLRLQFQSQQIDADTCFALMKAKIAEVKIQQFLEACFKTVGNVLKAGMAVSGAEKKPGEALEALVEAGKSAKEAVDAASAESPDRTLLDQAKTLMEMQEQLMTAFVAATTLWAQAQTNSTATELPQSLASVSIDPSLAWDNYMVLAEARLTSIKEMIGSDTEAEEAQAEANNYLASLKILAQYGKAIDAKFVAYASQLAQGTVVKAQIRAAQNIQERWKDLEKKAKSDEEKLAVLKGIIQTRMDAIKRSAFAAWTYYRNSYFFLYFQEPPAINLDMDAAQLRDVFAGASAWVARLLGDTPDGQKVRLPDDNVPVKLQFKVVRKGDVRMADVATALLTPQDGNQTAVLTWTIPLGISQLEGRLPKKGNVPIWIKDARFFLDGVKPNDKGNVIVEVSTSGAYENGYGPRKAYSFVSKGLVGNYAYEVQDQKVYNSWSINTEVYATPTPFTQWTMTFDPDGGDPSDATLLRMELVVAYRSQS